MTKPTLYLVAALIFVLDQLTKAWAVHHLPLDTQGVVVISRVLYLTRTSNTGSAFGLFPGSTVVLALAAFGAAVGISAYVFRARFRISLLLGFALALPLAGALGNFIDRVRLGYVVDFIEVYLGRYEWPIFNVADSAICIGVTLLAISYLRNADGGAKDRTATQLDPRGGDSTVPEAPPEPSRASTK